MRCLAVELDRFCPSSCDLRTKIIIIYTILIAVNVLVRSSAFFGFTAQYPRLPDTALLAYTFGLRHAVDADHISAIDNATRKLMQKNKPPVAVGFFFSPGHSTIVVGLSVAIAFAAAYVQNNVAVLKNAGGLMVCPSSIS